jgi:hypothetical protein
MAVLVVRGQAGYERLQENGNLEPVFIFRVQYLLFLILGYMVDRCPVGNSVQEGEELQPVCYFESTSCK